MLHERGHKIIGRNLHSRYGELDIVTVTNRTLHVVEVKTRRGNTFGAGAEAVTSSKLRKMRNTVSRLQQEGRLPRFAYRMHLVEVTHGSGKQGWKVTFYNDIFL